MHSQLQSNIGRLVASYRARIAGMDAALLAATRQAVSDFRRDGLKRMNDGIYNKAIPTVRETKATGGRKRARKAQPLWRRTGNLKRSERQKVDSPTQGRVINEAKYAAARHDMPGKLTWQHGDRTAHWRTDTINHWRLKGKLRSYYRDHLLGLLKQTAVR